jgi:hypothetical protein
LSQIPSPGHLAVAQITLAYMLSIGVVRSILIATAALTAVALSFALAAHLYVMFVLGVLEAQFLRSGSWSATLQLSGLFWLWFACGLYLVSQAVHRCEGRSR